MISQFSIQVTIGVLLALPLLFLIHYHCLTSWLSFTQHTEQLANRFTAGTLSVYLAFAAYHIHALVKVSLVEDAGAYGAFIVFLLLAFLYAVYIISLAGGAEILEWWWGVNTDKLMGKINSRILIQVIRRRYSTRISSVIQTFVRHGMIEVSYSGDIIIHEEKRMPKGHKQLGRDIKTLIKFLLDSQHDDYLKSQVEQAFVTGDRINQLAFVLGVVADDEKYEVLTKKHYPGCDTYFSVFKDINAELSDLKDRYETVKDKTASNEKELKEQRILRDIETLKNSTESLSI